MRADRYVRWLARRSRAIALTGALLVAASAYLAAFHLPIRADFSYLLPGDAPAVRDAELLAQRMPAQDTMLVVLVAPDPASRAAAAARTIAGIRAIPPGLIDHLDVDDAELRAFLSAHRWLFAPTSDLAAARDALAHHVADAKLRANPLYVDLDDAPPRPPDDLRARLHAAEARLARPAYVTADGLTQVLVIRTAFRATDVDRDARLMSHLDALAAQVRAAHPTVALGFAGGPAVTMAEHGALTRGIVLSSLITIALVALVLYLHLRSLRILALLTANIAAATIVAIGSAALTVGHLNAATAFLGAIIAGNGVNYGILLVARYIEERRTCGAHDAMATAIAGTLRPTLVASLGAAIAYGALGATHFRGFADFALIGGAGMLVCWVASFVLLPVLVLRFAPAPRRAPARLFGALVERVFSFRRPGAVCAAAAALALAAGAVTWRYIAADPFEYDVTRLRSRSNEALAVRRWLRVADAAFGRGLAGLAGNTYLAAERVDEVPAIVASLRAIAVRDPMVGPIASILDAVPADQPAKLALLAELRAAIDDAAPAADDATRADLAALRPPDDLAVITAADLPPAIRARLTELDGSVGRIVAVRPGPDFDDTDGRDLIAFASAVRAVRLPDGATVPTAGGGLLFADVLVQIQRDGPLVTAVAALGLVAMVILIVGRTRRAAAVLLATGAGSLAMVAACALAGVRINFLDFVALPITLGLGIDYAINVADRAAEGDPRVALRSTGGTVLVCSLTTMIGYASLLVSDNLAIRGFGTASLIGEVTCVIAALVIVPAVIALPRLAERYADPASSRA